MSEQNTTFPEGVAAPAVTYEFRDQVERSRAELHNIAEYAEDPTLGQNAEATILVKWTNQTYHDDNLRAMFTSDWDPVAGISRTNAWRHRNRYYDGLIVQAGLGVDFLDDESAHLVQPALQPTGVAMRRDGLTAFACANKILLSPDGDPSHVINVIENPNFARLHSVEFSPDGERLLTASSSLDYIHEVDLEGTPTWTLDLWRDTPFNVNTLGQTFHRTVQDAPGAGVLVNPDPVTLKNNESLRGAVCVLDNPASYDKLGLPTNLTPVFINTASYGNDGTVLATSFHRGEAWVIDRTTRKVDVVAEDMRNPHGLHRDPLLGGYVVTDTGHERVVFISDDLKREIAVDFSALEERKSGLEESRWLQYVTGFGENLYCAVVAPRQRLTLFDPVRRVKRDIPFDPEWGVQMVTRRERPNNVPNSLGNLVTKGVDPTQSKDS